MKKKIIAGLLGLLLLSAVCASFFMGGGSGGEGPAETFEGPLRVGVECDYPPYNWQEDKASETNVPLANRHALYAEGYDVQIAKALAGRMDVELEVNKIQWNALLPALHDGQIDVIISGMADTEARLNMPNFSASKTYNVNVAEYCLMLRSDSRYAEAFSLADLYGARVVGQRGTYLDTVIDQIPGVNHVQAIDTLAQMFDYIENDKADAVVVNLESAEAYIKGRPHLTFIRFPRHQGFRLGFTGICVWTRRKDRELLDAVNEALSKISPEERQKLMDLAKAKAGS